MSKTTYFLSAILFLLGCSSSKQLTDSKDDGLIEVIFLQVNDVYEIAPLPGDNRGGMARVATLKNQLLAKNNNTIMVMAGDFLSPSVIGTLDDENGDGIKGAHMVDVLNVAGLDLVTFGNHEFDLNEKDLQNRLNESDFEWVSSNVLHVTNGETNVFHKVKNDKKEYFPKTVIKHFQDADGTKLKVGFFGVTIDSKQQPYVKYQDFMQRSKDMSEELNPQVDIIIPLTHLDIEDDLELAKTITGFPLVVGGHDHHNMKHMVGSTVVAKADANAKTAYVHTLKYNKNHHLWKMDSELVKIDENIEEEEFTKSKVDYWKQAAADDLANKGFDPDKIITHLSSPLDGRESTVRGGQCDLGGVVTKAITAASSDKVEATMLNSGSIRVDDMLSGNLTQYDIIRILPYPSKILEVEMTGALLKKILEASAQNRGEGSYLQLHGIEIDEPSLTFRIGNELVRTDRNYTIAMNDFLLAGYDYKFLTRDTEGIVHITEPNTESMADLRNDLRKAVISYLEKRD